MRGTKLIAWRIPPIWEDLRQNTPNATEGSSVSQKQLKMFRETQDVLNSIAKDIRNGLLETVGVESSLSLKNDRSSVVLDLPQGMDTNLIARAIEKENVEAWRDTQGKVHIALNPWYSTKDVDQTVLGVIKVLHVLFGMHATVTAQPTTFKQKLMTSIMEVLVAQKSSEKRKN